MKFAYADPPYIGQARKMYAREAAADGRTAREVNHEILIGTLEDGYEAWALSLSVPSLRTILPLCPVDVRVMAWVKPFAAWKNVYPPAAWEPVIFKGGRIRTLKSDEYKAAPRFGEPVRDWISASVGPGHNPDGASVPGAKPPVFWQWMFRVLGAAPSDDFTDIFPGSGAGRRAWARYCGAYDSTQTPLFAPREADTDA